MMNSKELALKQIERVRENLNLVYKLLDYPEEIYDCVNEIDQSLYDLKYKVKKLKIESQGAEDPTDRQIDEIILERLEKREDQ